MIRLFLYGVIRGSLVPVLLSINLLAFNGLFSANPVLGATQDEDADQTFLLGEFMIRGDQVEELVEIRQEGGPQFPVLSTSLSWKGGERIELDIPKEILKNLTQPDLSLILKGKAEADEIDFD